MTPITSQCSGIAATGLIQGGAAGSACASERALSVAMRMRAVGSPSAAPDSRVNDAQRCASLLAFPAVAAGSAHTALAIKIEAAMCGTACIHFDIVQLPPRSFGGKD